MYLSTNSPATLSGPLDTIFDELTSAIREMNESMEALQSMDENLETYTPYLIGSLVLLSGSIIFLAARR